MKVSVEAAFLTSIGFSARMRERNSRCLSSRRSTVCGHTRHLADRPPEDPEFGAVGRSPINNHGRASPLKETLDSPTHAAPSHRPWAFASPAATHAGNEADDGPTRGGPVSPFRQAVFRHGFGEWALVQGTWVRVAREGILQLATVRRAAMMTTRSDDLAASSESGEVKWSAGGGGRTPSRTGGLSFEFSSRSTGLAPVGAERHHEVQARAPRRRALRSAHAGTSIASADDRSAPNLTA